MNGGCLLEQQTEESGRELESRRWGCRRSYGNTLITELSIPDGFDSSLCLVCGGGPSWRGVPFVASLEKYQVVQELLERNTRYTTPASAKLRNSLLLARS